MIPITYSYARVSKTDDAARSPETQLHVLQEFGIREEHIFTVGVTGSSLSRPGWNELMTQCSPTTPFLPFSAPSSYPEHQRPPKRLTENDLRASTLPGSSPLSSVRLPAVGIRPTACPAPLDDALGGDFLPAVQAKRDGSA